ncbi:MAG: di-heme enzyme [Myxococcaceae bacterium]|jgi:cytochrome c peroxidase|nr:di-heme enzyme [Myxococcaceae bacterium]
MTRLRGLVVIGLVGLGCAPAEPAWVWSLPPGFPTPLVPADNPMRPAAVEAGRLLFFDKRLSANETVSCASCHRPEHAFSDPRRRSVGLWGDEHPLSAPSLANVAYVARLGWATPEVTSLEQQARAPLFGEGAPIAEMGLDTPALRAEALARLRADSRYRALFERLEPGLGASFDFDDVIRAIASFERTLLSGTSSMDRALRGEVTAVSNAAMRGRRLFNEHVEGSVCHHCHNGLTLAVGSRFEGMAFDETVYVNVGLYNLGGTGAYPPGAEGLVRATGSREDVGKFRVPTMRNVAKTAPYMHDGSVETLAEVMAIYQRGGRLIESGPLAGDGKLNPLKDRGLGGMTLSKEQTADLLAYLESLTDEAFLNDPRFQNPFPEEASFGP